MRRVNPLSAESYYVEAGQWLGTRIEDILRGSLFIDGLKKGLSPADAAERVRLFHFDYQDIPQAVREARRYVAPFITWAVKNIPNEMANLITQPSKYARVERAVRAWEVEREAPEEAEAPDYLALPVYVGRDALGRPVYSNILNTVAFYDLAEFLRSPEGMGRYILTQFGPTVTVPFEAATNYNLFTGEPISAPALKEAGIPDLRLLIGPIAGQPEGMAAEARTAEALRTIYRPLDVLSRITTSPDMEGALRQTLTSVRGYPSSPYEPFQDALALRDAQRELERQANNLRRQLLESLLSGNERQRQLVEARLAMLERQIEFLAQRAREVASGQ
ncbi:hypothetical protein [Geochorda subterranea]|uniref:Large polyvalent protein associated domain-containing protein n=1 Tax=Geochorda subterranea TaxID=3109564 RepID=A0ABZ1BP49_9FIRM|nr:hypothetical protein [Limnochorda sp. LNt]WRP14591.1 hypothetical protein VLY81_00010 [Limnochorda sp. LNt]